MQFGKDVRKVYCDSQFIRFLLDNDDDFVFSISAKPQWAGYSDNATLTILPHSENWSSVKCELDEITELKSPSLSSFMQATAGDPGSCLNGPAVYLQITDACQLLKDVSKAKVRLHKVALVTLKNDNQTRCPFQKLAVNAQNAGYTVLIHFGDWPNVNVFSPTNEDKLFIPVLNVKDMDKNCKQLGFDEDEFKVPDDLALSEAHPINVEIVPEPRSDELQTMESYLYILYCWFLVGPIITLEWLRRTKKFCWMSGGQNLNNNGQTDENETEMRTMEEGGNRTEGSHLHSTIENYRDRDGEEQPLLTTQPTVINDCMRRHPRGTGHVNIIRKIPLREIAVGFLYGILVIAALPVGISCGGLSFFRFDDGMYLLTWLPITDGSIQFQAVLLLVTVWPTFQIFCFFMYSWFACEINWTIQTEFSKLIRGDWFASNIYLLVLGVVVPYCSLSEPFFYFLTYNTLCTVCNVLFILILNKHKVVTRYVFYISICMICAYVESNIVALFYFTLNSQGSLANLKLTALRTVAITVTLNISFNSSMYIVRKLVKPQESLFEGLGEK